MQARKVADVICPKVFRLVSGDPKRSSDSSDSVSSLDRTNYVEDVISAVTANAFIAQITTPTFSVPPHTVAAAHRELWADNGDALSRIYAGTGALNTSVTRSGGKRGWGALFSDASKSVGRAIQATFGDQEKQMSIDLFLVS